MHTYVGKYWPQSSEHAAGGHAGDRNHQLNRIADRMRDRVEIGVADITPAQSAAASAVASRIERHPGLRCAFLERAPRGRGCAGHCPRLRRLPPQAEAAVKKMAASRGRCQGENLPMRRADSASYTSRTLREKEMAAGERDRRPKFREKHNGRS
jgi:hypothetical protein